MSCVEGERGGGRGGGSATALAAWAGAWAGVEGGGGGGRVWGLVWFKMGCVSDRRGKTSFGRWESEVQLQVKD